MRNMSYNHETMCGFPGVCSQTMEDKTRKERLAWHITYTYNLSKHGAYVSSSSVFMQGHELYLVNQMFEISQRRQHHSCG